jgi:hypothetical protein
MKKSFLVLLIFFQSCTYLALNPPKNKSSSPLDNPLNLIGLFYLLNLKTCGGNGSFWARNIETNTSYCVSSTRVASASGADFYVQKGLDTGIDFSEIASAYNANIGPALDSTFGKASDINKDGKVIILTLDIIDGGNTTRGFVAGFVDPVDFTRDLSFSQLRSNEREILYMDGKELALKRKRSLEAGEKDPYLATVAHELQHLIRFPHSLGGDQTWIDEGTSEVASDLAGYGPQSDRIACFKGDACNSLGIQGTSPFTWSRTLENYAYSYAFMRYLYLASGSTESQRKAFLNASVIGSGSSRGNDATGLMEIFKLSEGYTSATGSTIPTSTSTLFQYLLTYFLGRSQDYADFSNTKVSIASSAVDLTDIHTDFPLTYAANSYSLPSGITSLSFFNSVGGTVSLAPGYAVRKIGSPSGSGTTVTGSSTYIAINPNSSGGSISASQITSLEEEPISLHEGINCITSDYLIQESRARSHVRRYLFDKP